MGVAVGGVVGVIDAVAVGSSVGVAVLVLVGEGVLDGVGVRGGWVVSHVSFEIYVFSSAAIARTGAHRKKAIRC